VSELALTDPVKAEMERRCMDGLVAPLRLAMIHQLSDGIGPEAHESIKVGQAKGLNGAKMLRYYGEFADQFHQHDNGLDPDKRAKLKALAEEYVQALKKVRNRRAGLSLGAIHPRRSRDSG
jgi:hypothetical protein